MAKRGRKPKNGSAEPTLSRPTLCIRGCHLRVVMTSEKSGLVWKCPTTRCGEIYLKSHYKILPQGAKYTLEYRGQ